MGARELRAIAGMSTPLLECGEPWALVLLGGEQGARCVALRCDGWIFDLLMRPCLFIFRFSLPERDLRSF